ncbi:MAG: Rrf2 family transcriptional regulator [Candidatus Omnitrophica bacterium]|nr:Rrf2 family transcriptional regulator [Candidatus Omnitrophota bacterium]MDD5429333.1 Rrf2 family transcriptional regulator [Candidatus Omnitrophota bacterium]
MKISTRARYGARLMFELALSYGDRGISLREIANNEGISEKYLSQIIIPLKAKGLIISFRGPCGGYALARDPSEINLREIVEILEGGLSILDCLNNSSLCKRSMKCPTRGVWDLLNNKIIQTLEAVTLRDLVEEFLNKSGDNLTYSI